MTLCLWLLICFVVCRCSFIRLAVAGCVRSRLYLFSFCTSQHFSGIFSASRLTASLCCSSCGKRTTQSCHHWDIHQHLHYWAMDIPEHPSWVHRVTQCINYGVLAGLADKPCYNLRFQPWNERLCGIRALSLVKPAGARARVLSKAQTLRLRRRLTMRTHHESGHKLVERPWHTRL